MSSFLSRMERVPRALSCPVPAEEQRASLAESERIDPSNLSVNSGDCFAIGDRALLVDAKSRLYMVEVAENEKFHCHSGHIELGDLVGVPHGSSVKSTGGANFVAVRPSLAESVLTMPRGAQVIYPKDLAAMLMAGDIYPGARVLEAGVGSGALSMALLRAGAIVTGYELREDFRNRATKNVRLVLGEDALSSYSVEVRDIYDGIDLVGFDRVMLDLPEPWRVLRHLPGKLACGGTIVSYLPGITQVSELQKELARGPFGLVETFEVLHRTWHVEARSVRPDHRMVAHTGFITHARYTGSTRPGELP